MARPSTAEERKKAEPLLSTLRTATSTLDTQINSRETIDLEAALLAITLMMTALVELRQKLQVRQHQMAPADLAAKARLSLRTGLNRT